jgi:acyl-CoA synthetase (AMP-forming)/AMP-acid ligase II/acyl carrier protein
MSLSKPNIVEAATDTVKRFAEEEAVGKLSIYMGTSLEKKEQLPFTLAQMLLNAVKQHEKNGIKYIQENGEDFFQTYPDLLINAQKVLSGLKAKGIQPQDKVIFQLSVNQDFITAFWACVLGGFVPVPINIITSDDPNNATIKKLLNVWQSVDKPMILADSKIKSILCDVFSEHKDSKIYSLVDLCEYPQDTSIYNSKSEDLALLLLTSGSTDSPKMVMQSHQALINRSFAAAQMNEFCSSDIFLNWFPLDHVGGIVMFHLQAASQGAMQLHGPIGKVLDNPLTWLDWIEKYKATVTWAPNFAYALINDCQADLKSRTWDLSSMRFILNGGEPIVAKQAKKFLSLLADFGLSPNAMFPSWGMSETCSGVTFSHEFSYEDILDEESYMAVGQPIPEFSLRIVSENNQLVEEGKVGQLQVKGPSVTTGYYKNPKANQESFTLDGWFKTGDLGILREGRLKITGRHKDIIIINGLNHYSHEIESSVEELEDVETSYTAAVGVCYGENTTDKLIIFFHPKSSNTLIIEKLIEKIRSKVIRDFGIKADCIVPLEKENIPKTSIGKIQRSILKAKFEEGQFLEAINKFDKHNFQPDEKTYVAPRTEKEKALCEILQNVLKVEKIGIQDDFFKLGGDSITSIRFINRLNQKLGVKVQIKDVFKCRNIEQLYDKVLANH